MGKYRREGEVKSNDLTTGRSPDLTTHQSPATLHFVKE
jgi:hypothetical protein